MNTKAKSNSVITHSVSGQRITFSVKDVGDMVLNIGAIHVNNVQQATVHGFIQRISDAAAISRNPETGQPATAQEKYDAMKRLIDHYESGTSEWSRVAVAGEGKSGGLFVRALCQLTGKPVSEVHEWTAKQDKSDLIRLRHSARIAEIIASFRSSDTEEVANRLLDELK